MIDSYFTATRSKMQNESKMWREASVIRIRKLP